jgi:capsular polysaccharide transport system permease protein
MPTQAAPGGQFRKAQAPKAYRRSFASTRVVIALMLREMSSTYGRTPAGFLWAIAEPIAGIALLSLVFSAAFQEPTLGTNFALFYATGFIPFSSFVGLASKIGMSLMFSRQLLAYPSVTWVDAIVARLMLNFLVDLLVAFIILAGIILIYDLRLIINAPAAVLSMVMAASIALGVGLMNSYLFLRFPSWQRVFSIIMRPMFVLSCIFFSYEMVPQPFQDWLWWNPLIHVVGMMRSAFYSYYEPDYISVLYVFGVSGVLAVFGLILLGKNHQDLLNR